MKTRYILFCSVLLAPMMALSQSKPVTVFINTATKPASAGGETKLFADSFEAQVSQQLRDKYPCAQTTSAADVGAVLDWDRQRELMGGDIGDAELKDIAGSVGAKYFISLTVSELGSGQLSLKASMVDTTTTPLQTQANRTNITSGGEAAYDAIKAMATQFVDSLSSLSQFSKEKCNPTNRWTGTITYHLAEEKNETTKGTVVGLDTGTATTTSITSNNYDVTIHIGWTSDYPNRLRAQFHRAHARLEERRLEAHVALGESCEFKLRGQCLDIARQWQVRCRLGRAGDRGHDEDHRAQAFRWRVCESHGQQP
jgi:hypothetical protein